ncbi:unnamed protein product [Tetraodon nigroviridis]|uniref:(spotted green pufferfish) hypothetical protein n=1 Tax=Tetraodon nigroviridis TaxID=99883 RepID=Q4S414_TETNG|nr:unnamed protein product [Tetraodon nigroviridis]
MYLNYILNPGSLSYLLTNGPEVRHSTASVIYHRSSARAGRFGLYTHL